MNILEKIEYDFHPIACLFICFSMILQSSFERLLILLVSTVKDPGWMNGRMMNDWIIGWTILDILAYVLLFGTSVIGGPQWGHNGTELQKNRPSANYSRTLTLYTLYSRPKADSIVGFLDSRLPRWFWANINTSLLYYTISRFLDASSHLYLRVCPSLRPSVGPSVGPSVRRSAGWSRFCKKWWWLRSATEWG